jgi:hypothetical protein
MSETFLVDHFNARIAESRLEGLDESFGDVIRCVYYFVHNAPTMAELAQRDGGNPSPGWLWRLVERINPQSLEALGRRLANPRLLDALSQESVNPLFSVLPNDAMVKKLKALRRVYVKECSRVAVNGVDEAHTRAAEFILHRMVHSWRVLWKAVKSTPEGHLPFAWKCETAVQQIWAIYCLEAGFFLAELPLLLASIGTMMQGDRLNTEIAAITAFIGARSSPDALTAFIGTAMARSNSEAALHEKLWHEFVDLVRKSVAPAKRSDFQGTIQRLAKLADFPVEPESPRRIRGSVAAIVQRPTDGPQRPNLFYWNGKYAELPKTLFRLVEYLWNCKLHTADIVATARDVWRDEEKASALPSARTRINGIFSSTDPAIPIEVNIVGDFVKLTIHPSR